MESDWDIQERDEEIIEESRTWNDEMSKILSSEEIEQSFLQGKNEIQTLEKECINEPTNTPTGPVNQVSIMELLEKAKRMKENEKSAEVETNYSHPASSFESQKLVDFQFLDKPQTNPLQIKKDKESVSLKSSPTKDPKPKKEDKQQQTDLILTKQQQTQQETLTTPGKEDDAEETNNTGTEDIINQLDEMQQTMSPIITNGSYVMFWYPENPAIIKKLQYSRLSSKVWSQDVLNQNILQQKLSNSKNNPNRTKNLSSFLHKIQIITVTEALYVHPSFFHQSYAGNLRDFSKYASFSPPAQVLIQKCFFQTSGTPNQRPGIPFIRAGNSKCARTLFPQWSLMSKEEQTKNYKINEDQESENTEDENEEFSKNSETVVQELRFCKASVIESPGLINFQINFLRKGSTKLNPRAMRLEIHLIPATTSGSKKNANEFLSAFFSILHNFSFQFDALLHNPLFLKFERLERKDVDSNTWKRTDGRPPMRHFLGYADMEYTKCKTRLAQNANVYENDSNYNYEIEEYNSYYYEYNNSNQSQAYGNESTKKREYETQEFNNYNKSNRNYNERKPNQYQRDDYENNDEGNDGYEYSNYRNQQQEYPQNQQKYDTNQQDPQNYDQGNSEYKSPYNRYKAPPADGYGDEQNFTNPDSNIDKNSNYNARYSKPRNSYHSAPDDGYYNNGYDDTPQ